MTAAATTTATTAAVGAAVAAATSAAAVTDSMTCTPYKNKKVATTEISPRDLVQTLMTSVSLSPSLHSLSFTGQVSDDRFLPSALPLPLRPSLCPSLVLPLSLLYMCSYTRFCLSARHMVNSRSMGGSGS